jgi:hypothetical protein
MSKLKDENVLDDFIDAYVGSNLSLNDVENMFSPTPPPVPKPINRTRKNAPSPVTKLINRTRNIVNVPKPITRTRNIVNASPPVPKPITRTRKNVNEVKRKIYANAALRLKKK